MSLGSWCCYEGRKQFFFEKKNQKTFVPLREARSHGVRNGDFREGLRKSPLLRAPHYYMA
jgi:hypothetical protein